VVEGYIVINENPYSYSPERGGSYGFYVEDSSAVLFRFSAESLGVPVEPAPAVPEPATAATLAGIVALGLAAASRRQPGAQRLALRS
jgi:hypothetical protein